MRALALVVAIWFLSAAQLALGPRLAIFGAQPSFLLCVLAVVGPTVGRQKSTFLGFAIGVISGAIAGINMVHFVISRTVAGFLVGWSNELRIEANVATVAICAAGCTVIAQILLMLLAPPPAIIPYLNATILSAIYNGVIAVPMFLAARQVLGLPKR